MCLWITNSGITANRPGWVPMGIVVVSQPEPSRAEKARAAVGLAETRAAGQGGAITRGQAIAAGVSRHTVRWRVSSGRWQRVLPGVFVVTTGQLDWRARASAALVGTGAPSVLSHASAAYIYGFETRAPAVIDISVPNAQHLDAPPGVRLWRRRHWADIEDRGWPPTTSVAETVLDLGDTGSVDDAFAYAARACQRELTTAGELAGALTLRSRFRWRRQLGVALDAIAEGVQSGLEVLYVRDVEQAHGLPRGVRQESRQGPLGRYFVDTGYRAFRLVVELDGRLGHDGPGIWRDEARDNANTMSGAATLRFGWVTLTVRACSAAGQVATLMRRGGWTGFPTRCGPRCTLGAPGSG